MIKFKDNIWNKATNSSNTLTYLSNDEKADLEIFRNEKILSLTLKFTFFVDFNLLQKIEFIVAAME